MDIKGLDTCPACESQDTRFDDFVLCGNDKAELISVCGECGHHWTAVCKLELVEITNEYESED